MKTTTLTTLFVAAMAATTMGFAQDSGDTGPYAIFGQTHILGENNTPSEKIFVIRNVAENSPVDRIEHNTRSGIIKVFGKDGELIGEKQLTDAENAWTTPDPMAEKYYSISPYAYCNNNPIRYIDPNGMEFTESAWKSVNQLISEINSQQEKNNKQIAEKQAKLGNANLSERRINKLNRQIYRLNEANGNLNAARGEISVLAASSQVYDVLSDNSMNTNDMTVGAFKFNNSNGIAEISMPDGGGMGLFAHELKHAYQFETGQLSIGPKGLPFYDKMDEVEAYNRGAMFGQTRYGLNNLPEIYNPYPKGPIDATNHPNIMHLLNNPTQLQKIANNTNSAFRIGGVTYYNQK